jgi:hypothetical protein
VKKSEGYGKCGNLEAKKTYHGPRCYFKANMGFNGARNILLMNMNHHFVLNPLRMVQVGANHHSNHKCSYLSFYHLVLKCMGLMLERSFNL